MVKSKKIFFILATLLIAIFALPLVACNNNDASIQSIEIVKPADKAVYEQGEFFDDTGMIVDATLSDGTIVKNVDFKCMKKTALTPQDSVVTIAYGGKKVNFKITVRYKGNNDIYSVANTPALESSELSGKTIFFLGSSVTYGSGSEGEAMGEFIAKRNACTVIKEAVPGTTLADIDNPIGKSYVKRLDEYINSDDCASNIDIFVCQLSTNDMNADAFGTVTADNVTEISAFDKATTYGAMEYVIARVTQKWSCPIMFYTNNKISNTNYAAMVEAAHALEKKYTKVSVLDLYNDAEFNAITDEQRALYMTDSIHPTKAGYRDWWLPEFESMLIEIEDNKVSG